MVHYGIYAVFLKENKITTPRGMLLHITLTHILTLGAPLINDTPSVVILIAQCYIKVSSGG